MGAVSIAVLAWQRGNCGDAIQLEARFGIAAIFALHGHHAAVEP
jgi:hypothetical protein